MLICNKLDYEWFIIGLILKISEIYSQIIVTKKNNKIKYKFVFGLFNTFKYYLTQSSFWIHTTQLDFSKLYSIW